MEKLLCGKMCWKRNMVVVLGVCWRVVLMLGRDNILFGRRSFSNLVILVVLIGSTRKWSGKWGMA